MLLRWKRFAFVFRMHGGKNDGFILTFRSAQAHSYCKQNAELK